MCLDVSLDDDVPSMKVPPTMRALDYGLQLMLTGRL